MSDYIQTKLAIENSLRSPTKVRQLTPEQLGIPGDEDEDPWDALIEKAKDAAKGDQTGVAVRTEKNSVTTGCALSKGTSREVHPLEFAVWKAYDQDQSKVTEVAIYSSESIAEPCGRCLQVLADYSDEVNPEIRSSNGEKVERSSLDEKLPY